MRNFCFKREARDTPSKAKEQKSKRASAYVEASPHYCVKSNGTRIPNSSQEQNCSVLTNKNAEAKRNAHSAKCENAKCCYSSANRRARSAKHTAQTTKCKPQSVVHNADLAHYLKSKTMQEIRKPRRQHSKVRRTGKAVIRREKQMGQHNRSKSRS